MKNIKLILHVIVLMIGCLSPTLAKTKLLPEWRRDLENLRFGMFINFSPTTYLDVYDHLKSDSASKYQSKDDLTETHKKLPEEYSNRAINFNRPNGSYTNDILSHNSLWMQNMAVLSANMGYNVLYVTLEMSERKVMKRLGAMRLKIPINDYDEVSKDTEFMQKRINAMKNSSSSGDLFEKKIGKIYTKFWAAGTAGVADFELYLQKVYDVLGIKIDLIIVDYLTLMVPPKNNNDTLYLKGKNLAEGLRALGSKYKCPVITALQVAKEAWNAANISLESVPESKAIPETSDSFFAIIRTEEMKRQNLYRLKMLKQRDGDFSKSQIRLHLNPTYLTLENDVFIDAV